MSALRGGSLTEFKRVKGLTICIAVILGLACAGGVSAGPTLLVTLDADSPTTGSLLTTTTSEGDITFSGTYITSSADPDMSAAGATGNTFDLYGPGSDAWAQLTFDFDVCKLANFVFGGNLGDIEIIAYDASDNQVAYFYQDDTYHWYDLYGNRIGYFAGPITLETSGAAIRRLYWTDLKSPDTGYAALDNIEVWIDNVIPAPGAITLAVIGIGFVGGLRKRAIA